MYRSDALISLISRSYHIDKSQLEHAASPSRIAELMEAVILRPELMEVWTHFDAGYTENGFEFPYKVYIATAGRRRKNLTLVLDTLGPYLYEFSHWEEKCREMQALPIPYKNVGAQGMAGIWSKIDNSKFWDRRKLDLILKESWVKRFQVT